MKEIHWSEDRMRFLCPSLFAASCVLVRRLKTLRKELVRPFRQNTKLSLGWCGMQPIKQVTKRKTAKTTAKYHVKDVLTLGPEDLHAIDSFDS